MTNHDEVRKILYETGFTFKDSDRTALEMTDEEVNAFIVEFIARMSELGRQMSVAFQKLTVSIVQATKPLQDLGRVLAEAEAHQKEE